MRAKGLRDYTGGLICQSGRLPFSMAKDLLGGRYKIVSLLGAHRLALRVGGK
jgi:hypothetical protein